MQNQSKKKITLGFSTCPNDTFMFDALVHGRIETGKYEFEVWMGDILHLNQKATAGELDMIKISYNTYGAIQKDYHLLDAGSALGHNCGPLLIVKDDFSLESLENDPRPVAIPGRNTTANLLLNFFAPQLKNRKEMIFDEVMPSVVNGECKAGVIIHENRFTYQQHGLTCLQDLGEYWEAKTGLPIPLGAIVAKKSLGEKVLADLERMMRESVEYAFENREASLGFVREHAQEMEDEVMQAHINLYVNDFSVSLGEEGRAAVKKLLSLRDA